MIPSSVGRVSPRGVIFALRSRGTRNCDLRAESCRSMILAEPDPANRHIRHRTPAAELGRQTDFRQQVG